MNVSKAIDCWMEYHKLHSRKNTVQSYQSTVAGLRSALGDRELNSLSSEDILAFLTDATDGSTQLTKRTRYAHLRSLFNFIKNNLSPEIRNPCDSPMLRKLFRTPPARPWKILEKEAVDEVIFRITKPRNRLILELMARRGMRISEVLKLTPEDIEDRKLILRDPKSGRGREVAYIPQKVADRLKAYTRIRCQSKQVISPAPPLQIILIEVDLFSNPLGNGIYCLGAHPQLLRQGTTTAAEMLCPNIGQYRPRPAHQLRPSALTERLGGNTHLIADPHG